MYTPQYTSVYWHSLGASTSFVLANQQHLLASSVQLPLYNHSILSPSLLPQPVLLQVRAPQEIFCH